MRAQPNYYELINLQGYGVLGPLIAGLRRDRHRIELDVDIRWLCEGIDECRLSKLSIHHFHLQCNSSFRYAGPLQVLSTLSEDALGCKYGVDWSTETGIVFSGIFIVGIV